MLVRSGIRQGGILSPLLFNIYINTIITALEKWYGILEFNVPLDTV